MMSDKEVDDLIEMWHESEEDVPIHEFLGWTKEQYKRWVETGEIPVTPGAN